MELRACCDATTLVLRDDPRTLSPRPAQPCVTSSKPYWFRRLVCLSQKNAPLVSEEGFEHFTFVALESYEAGGGRLIMLGAMKTRSSVTFRSAVLFEKR